MYVLYFTHKYIGYLYMYILYLHIHICNDDRIHIICTATSLVMYIHIILAQFSHGGRERKH